MGDAGSTVLDFWPYVGSALRPQADFLVVADDDRNIQMKRDFLAGGPTRLIVILKPRFHEISTTLIRERVQRLQKGIDA